MKTIRIELMNEAIELSTQWGNTGFIVKNADGSLAATVWNKWKWEETAREVVAYVDDNGFIIKEGFENEYELEATPAKPTVKEFKEYWIANNSHISLELTDQTIKDIIKKTDNLNEAIDRASDYLLAQGAAGVQE